MNRVTPAPTLPQDDQKMAYRLRLHDYLREHAVAINQAAEQRLFLPAAVTGAYSAGENDHVILIAPSAPCTITLPAASTYSPIIRPSPAISPVGPSCRASCCSTAPSCSPNNCSASRT